MKKHPHHKVIINTHAYMYSDDTRMGEGDRWLPQKYGLGKDTGENAVNNGEQMWDKLVSKYPNILFVFSGHVLNGGVGTLVSTGEQGNKVYQMLANFQDGVKGTNRGQTGFLRIVDIDVKKKQVKVTTDDGREQVKEVSEAELARIRLARARELDEERYKDE